MVYESPPMIGNELNTDEHVIRRIVNKFDLAKRDARARTLGETGEAFLFQAEKDRLSANGRDDLASKVRWVSKEDGDGAGLIFCPFRSGGVERWLEVKTTNGHQQRLSGFPQM